MMTLESLRWTDLPAIKWPPLLELPDAVEVMDTFHFAKLADVVLAESRRRVQLESTGQRRRAKNPQHRTRRTLHTDDNMPTTTQQEKIAGLRADPNFSAVEVAGAV